MNEPPPTIRLAASLSQKACASRYAPARCIRTARSNTSGSYSSRPTVISAIPVEFTRISQLAQCLFVPGDAVAIDQSNEVRRRVAAERRLGEMRIGGMEAIGGRADIGEIAPPAARDQDLLPRLVGMVDQQHPPAALTGRRRTHQPGRAGAEDDEVVSGGHSRGDGWGLGVAQGFGFKCAWNGTAAFDPFRTSEAVRRQRRKPQCFTLSRDQEHDFFLQAGRVAQKLRHALGC